MNDSHVTTLKDFATAHRFLVDEAARHAGIQDPVVIQNTCNYRLAAVLKESRRKAVFAIVGVLIRGWYWGEFRRSTPYCAAQYLHDYQGIPFVHVSFNYAYTQIAGAFDFVVVERKNHARLYRAAIRCVKLRQQKTESPILHAKQKETLWDNTIGFLDRPNMGEILKYGGRGRRGVLLAGSPGNGKTMACRWIWSECVRRNWEWRIVTPDMYRNARQHDSVQDLFSVQRRGILFFDDMDRSLRDRDTVGETEDQGIFLTALDGIRCSEGIVFVFTTNCSLSLLDRAFKRPGRIDVVMHFKEPNADLRRQLIHRWHADIQAGIDIEAAVRSTDGYSFAELDELKNLLIMRFVEKGTWDWKGVLKIFSANREEFNASASRRLGFGAETNGHSVPVPPYDG